MKITVDSKTGILKVAGKTFEELDKYKQVFEKIEAIVESPELKRYIPLMQTPLPFPKNESKTKTLFSKLQIDTSLSLLNFKKRCNLAENLYYLLLIFYNNRETPLSIEEPAPNDNPTE